MVAISIFPRCLPSTEEKGKQADDVQATGGGSLFREKEEKNTERSGKKVP